MDDHTLFGKRIRAIREGAGLSREALAEKIGRNANYLGEVERGEKWPALEIIRSLASSLSVSPAAFFEFEAEEEDPKILLSRLHKLLANRKPEQLQMALRVLKAVFGV